MAYPDARDKLADLLTSIHGADFDETYARRVVGKFGGMAVPVASLADLILLKKMAVDATDEGAKARDQADIEALEALQQEA